MIVKTLRLAARQVRGSVVPVVTAVSQKKDPYLVLVSCILSLRTKDRTAAEASARLFRTAHTPKRMAGLEPSRISRLIYPVGFYRTKARVIRDISRRITEDFNGRVPGTIDGLLGLKGVGRKTANLVLGLGFGKPAICVDTHVHRISNRLGWVKTQNVFDTEKALCRIVPKRWWIELNTVLVTFGQNVCQPVSPRCSQCSIYALCKRRGVIRSR